MYARFIIWVTQIVPTLSKPLIGLARIGVLQNMYNVDDLMKNDDER